MGNRYMELTYEELTIDPERWMRKICEFLVLDFDIRVLQSAMPQSAKKNDYQIGYVGKIEPNSKKFLKQFSAPQIQRLEQIAGELLDQLGYETIYAIGSEDIGWFRARRMRFVDFLKANHRLRSKLTGRRPVSWRKVYRGLLASLREYSAKKY